jgi:hypothetical protein
MNTVGKILVILNFLFAVIVGAFLVVDFATRTSWKNEYDKLKAQVTVLVAERDAFIRDDSTQRGSTKTMAEEVDKLRIDLADQVARAKAEQLAAEQKVTEAQIKQKEADVNLAKVVADVGRLKTGEQTLKGIITEREKAILELQSDVKKYRTEAVANETLNNQLQDRNKELLDQLSKISSELNRIKVNVASGVGDGPRIETHNEANPPSGMVKGKIEKVDAKDNTLVQISVGTDHGVNKNNTMEVFRTTPSPKYLGMVRIVDASPHHSVGRLIVPPGASRPQLQEGDLVWSRLR